MNDEEYVDPELDPEFWTILKTPVRKPGINEGNPTYFSFIGNGIEQFIMPTNMKAIKVYVDGYPQIELNDYVSFNSVVSFNCPPGIGAVVNILAVNK